MPLLGCHEFLFPVVDQSGSGGIWEPRLNLQRYGVEQGLGNHITRKWRTRNLAIHRLVAGRIEDHVLHDGSARRVGAQRPSREGRAEIPVLHRNRRHGHIRVRLAVRPVQFQVGEKERLVTAVVQVGDDHRAADRTAIVPAPRIGPQVVPVAGTGISPARVQIFVLHKDERHAVQSIGAGLGREVVEAPGDLAEFGGKVAALQGEFL